MKNEKGIGLITLLIVVAIIISGIVLFFNLFTDKTKVSTEELANEVQRKITENWRQDGKYFTVLEDMILIKKSENEYAATMKIMYKGKPLQISGNVIYDGQHINWQPDTDDLFLQLYNNQ